MSLTYGNSRQGAGNAGLQMGATGFDTVGKSQFSFLRANPYTDSNSKSPAHTVIDNVLTPEFKERVTKARSRMFLAKRQLRLNEASNNNFASVPKPVGSAPFTDYLGLNNESSGLQSLATYAMVAAIAWVILF